MPELNSKEGLTLPAMTLVNHAVSSFSSQNETGWGQSMLQNDNNRDNETTMFMSVLAKTNAN